MGPGQGVETRGKGPQPGRVLRGQGQGQGRPGRCRPHGGEIAQAHRQALVAQGPGIDIRQEMDAGHQGVDADRQFLVRRHPQQGTVVAHPQDDIAPLRPEPGEVGADEGEFRQGRLRRRRPGPAPRGAPLWRGSPAPPAARRPRAGRAGSQARTFYGWAAESPGRGRP